MPEFSVKEVRLPELHLPEIKRDEIVRSLSGIRLPEPDLAKVKRARIRMPAVVLSGSDVGRLIAAGAAVARFVRRAPSRGRWLTGPVGRHLPASVVRVVQPRPRRRWPFVLGAIIAGAVVTWAILRRPSVRLRIDATTRRAREQFEALREGRPEGAGDEPVAMSDAESARADAEAMPALEASPTPG